MTKLDMLGVFASTFALVFLYGVQSRAVQASRYLAAALLSSAISIMNTVVTRAAVSDDLTSFLLASCSGGSLGIVAAIWTYNHVAHRLAGR